MRTYNLISKYVKKMKDSQRDKKNKTRKVWIIILLVILVLLTLAIGVLFLLPLKIKYILICVLFAILVALVITLCVLDSKFQKYEFDNWNEKLHKEFGDLESVIKEIYYPTGSVSNIDLSVVDDLIQIYDSETKSKEKNIKFISVLMGGLFSGAIALGNLFKFEISVDASLDVFEDLFVGSMELYSVIVILIALVGWMGYFITNEGMKLYEKIIDYKWFLELLKHYKVYLDGKNSLVKNDIDLRKPVNEKVEENVELISLKGKIIGGKNIKLTGKIKKK